jgi:hypothetical protein
MRQTRWRTCVDVLGKTWASQRSSSHTVCPLSNAMSYSWIASFIRRVWFAGSRQEVMEP